MAILHVDNSHDGLDNVGGDRVQSYGLAGNDTLTSDNNSEVLLIGGSGDDSLIMLGGDGTLSGGKGADVFELTYSAGKPISVVIEDLEPSQDKIVVNFDGDTVPQLSSKVDDTGNVVWKDNDGLFNLTLKSVRENDYFDGTAYYEAWAVLAYTNDEREDEGLPLLTMSDGLTQAAQIRAEEITKLGESGVLNIYKHTRPDNKGDYSTVFDDIGKIYYNYGENLLAIPSAYPDEAVDEWMSSDSHRENILNPDFLKLGVGLNYYDEDKSNLRYYWTQLFADGLSSTERETVGADELLTAIPEVNTVSKSVTLDEGNNSISNSDYGATIWAHNGDNSINNTGLLAFIYGGVGKDTIENSGAFVTIHADVGNDYIKLTDDAEENVIRYIANDIAGDGNDTVIGFNETSTLDILGYFVYTPVTIGNDVIVSVAGASITLLDAAELDEVNIRGTRSKLFILTDGDDYIENTVDGATINALGGNDSIYNEELSNIIIDGGEGNDTISNIYGSSLTMSGGEGADSLYNRGENVVLNGNAGDDFVYNASIASGVTINSDAGNDDINNFGNNVTIDGGSDDDTISNGSTFQIGGEAISINGGSGEDRIYNYGSDVTVDGNAGKDFIRNYVDLATLGGGSGNDTIYNWGASAIIDGGADDDKITNWEGSNVSIEGGAGNDTLTNSGAFVTINGGEGNEVIELSSDAQNNLILYTPGDGRDMVFGFNTDDTLRIGDGTGTYSTRTMGDIFVVSVGKGFIALADSASLINDLTIEGIEGEATGIENLVELDENANFYSNSLEGEVIYAFGGDDSIENTNNHAVIYGGADNDSITNTGNTVSLYGSEGNDSIYSSGLEVTIDGGTDNDIISLSSDAQNNLILYAEGDGKDTVSGFKLNDTLSISGDYSTQTSGNDLVVNVDTGFIMLLDAASLSAPNIISGSDDSDEESKKITLTEGEDTHSNTVAGATILALGGNDYINNFAASVAIDGGDGDDTFRNQADGKDSSLLGGAGNDTIINSGINVSINGGEGIDSILSQSDSVTISGGDAADWLYNSGDNVSISGDAGDDYIQILDDARNVTIAGGDGADIVYNEEGSSVTVDLGDGDDIIRNYENTSNVTINGGAGNDSVNNSGSNVAVDLGAGNDSILNSGSSSTITGGDGNDDIWNDINNVLIDGGDGNDTIENENAGTEVTIDGGAGDDSVSNKGSNISINGGAGKDFIFNDGANVTITGGTDNDQISLSSDSNNNYINYNVGDGDDTIWGLTRQNAIINITGEKYFMKPSGDDIVIKVGTGSITLKDYRDKPKPIIIGSSGTSGGTGGNGGTGSNSGTGGGGSGGSTSGTSNSGNSSAASGGNSASGSSGSSSSGTSGTNSGRGNDNTNTTANQHWGNINYDDAIFGGGDADTFTGTDDADTFISGKNQGSDTFKNISPKDTIYLSDVTLSDLVNVKDVNGFIYLGFNTGNTLTIQSAELLSGAIQLADGTAHRFNHMTRTWQN